MLFIMFILSLLSFSGSQFTMSPLAISEESEYTTVNFTVIVADAPEIKDDTIGTSSGGFPTSAEDVIPDSDGDVTISIDIEYEDELVFEFERDWTQGNSYICSVYHAGVNTGEYNVIVTNEETGNQTSQTQDSTNQASGSGSEAADQLQYYFENQLKLTLGIDDNQFFLLVMSLPMLGLILSIAFGQPILMVIFLGVSSIFLIVGASAVIVYYATNQDQIPGMKVFDDLIAGLRTVSWAAGGFIDFLIFWKTVWLFLYIFLTVLVFTMRFILPFIILTYVLKYVAKLQAFMEIGRRL